MREKAIRCISILLLALSASFCRADVPKPIFYLPLDASTTAALAGGARTPRIVGEEDTILTLIGLRRNHFAPGQVGQCYDISNSPLVFRCAGNFRPDEGACSFWLSPHFRGDDKNRYCAFFGAADWGMLYKYQDQSSLTFGTAKPGRDIYYDCAANAIGSWQPDEWHHVAVSWSRQGNARRIYIDGKLVGNGPFPFHRAVEDGPLFIGSGCTLYPGHVAYARMDEVAIWDQPLPEQTIQELYTLGKAGKPLWRGEPAAVQITNTQTPRLNVVRPNAPTAPAGSAVPPQRTRTRELVPLDGWWHFLPAADPVDNLPEKGWGWTRVPGYWTGRQNTLGPDGKPVTDRWEGQPLSRFSLGYYQRTFTALPEWRGKNVFLQLDGVDGLAEIYLNGQLLGRLPGWEDEAYDLGAALRQDGENTLTIALFTRGGSSNAGIYGNIALRILPRAFVNDVAVRPLVEKGQIQFSCYVWNASAPATARLEFDVAANTAPGQPVKQFSLPCPLSKSPRAQTTLSAQVQRVDFTFPWKEARPWTIDDPFLYQVRARLRLGGELVDESPAVRFGFREFTKRGGDFILNGKPTHLRGHQIDLRWGNQMERVKELKAAGMNCFELSGPISCDWYAGTPYQLREYEEILNYADEQGLIALPILPDAIVLRDRLFDPEVAALYRRRIDAHVRRYGNHASVGMWYMHFNLAGYRWYIAPSKIDGSYKPTDAGFLGKEKYAREAQGIASLCDPRPIYHHACGNFGDIFSLNCYIGPSAPLQEREEWPSRWAEKRPFPLVACEHCLMLIPYWFRPRLFPLSEVYAGEPIFDELTANYLGRHAYSFLTPELFDLYDVGKKPRGGREKTLIQHHPGYQEVKTIYARHSLRAWRTYGVSGIIFNAENWDFKDEQGNPLPVMKAMARYFGDTDLYIAGPAGNWPSKDHSFTAGEKIGKQIVLLNDLTRDIPCTLGWRLADAAGKVYASGRVQMTARAGQPTFAPLECTAPPVTARSNFRLLVDVITQPGKEFQPESFPLEIFPQPQRPVIGGKILLFDPVGETTRMLQRAGIAAEPLAERSDLAAASLLVVGKKAYGEAFLALAKKLNLEGAIRSGLRLLLCEQSGGAPGGLKLEERSLRQVFPAQSGHPFLAGLAPEDFANWRGESDLVEAYPDAPPETERTWPKRFFKWGNRGVVSTFVLTKPHYAPFTPILECGFDLVQSPLLEARFGKGRVVLCQLDVTARYGADPVATRLVNNLLAELTRKETTNTLPCASLGASAQAFLRPFGIVPEVSDPQRAGVIVIGREALDAGQVEAATSAARRGATLLLLPGANAASAFGLRMGEERLFIGRLGKDALLAGLNDGDLYLKQWTTLPAILPENGWQNLVTPGILAVKKEGQGRIIACTLDPGSLGETRGRIKALRFWNVLLANLGAQRTDQGSFLQPASKVYEENAWEEMPPYMNW